MLFERPRLSASCHGEAKPNRLFAVKPLGTCGRALAHRAELLFEGLVFPEIRDGQAQRIDGDELIWDVGFENENEVGCV